MATDPATQTQTLYGAFPTYLVAQRASSDQASTLYSAAGSSVYNSAQIDQCLKGLKEVSATLIALGFWKGSA